MTHTPTLPNGFSRGFSDVVDRDEILVWYVSRSAGLQCGMGPVDDIDGMRVWVDSEYYVLLSDCLCWCPIPTPGNAVLKELAEEGK